MKTKQQIEAFDTQQRRNDIHPFTCPNPHGNDAERLLRLREDGCLYCANCDYVQSYVPPGIPFLEKKLPTVNEMVGIYNLPVNGDKYVRHLRDGGTIHDLPAGNETTGNNNPPAPFDIHKCLSDVAELTQKFNETKLKTAREFDKKIHEMYLKSGAMYGDTYEMRWNWYFKSVQYLKGILDDQPECSEE